MRFALVLSVAMLSACASAPKAPQAPTPAAPPPASAAAPAATPAATPEDKFATIDASNIAEAQAAGYNVVDGSGTQLICRKTRITGTRLSNKTTCLTAAEWKAEADAARETMSNTTTPFPRRD